MGDNKYLSIASDVLEKMQENMPIEGDICDLADLFKMFADSTRLKILCILYVKVRCVSMI